MKQNRTKIFCIIILLIAIIFPNISNSAYTYSRSGYTINSYDIEMVVNENNSFDIVETIDVNFTGTNKHGIFRKIPLRNTVRRLDGTQSKNRAKISNIKVSEEYSISNEGTNKVIKIGSASKTVSGLHSYIIKYTYELGKDPLKEVDELYYNLIGTQWDTEIENTTFKITMPKEFDVSTLGFSSGSYGTANSSNITYNVEGTVITGKVNKTLNAGEGVTVRLTLPEGYFTNSSNVLLNIIQVVVPIIFVIIAYLMWSKYGRDDMVVETVEFYPPDGLNSAETAFAYEGKCDSKDVISLLIYLANKGYLKIEEEGKKSFKIIKLKEYDGNNEYEKEFFSGLFKGKDSVTKASLHNRFYITIDKILLKLNSKKNQEKIFEKASTMLIGVIMVMIIITFILMGGLGVFDLALQGVDEELIFIPIVVLVLPIVLCIKPNTIWAIINGTILPVAAFFGLYYNGLDSFVIIQFLIGTISLELLITFLCIMKKRTKYGTEMLGKIRGFKNFLEVAEKPKLEELVSENPEYFYDILPYTYALGVSKKWMDKFQDIAIPPPSWYDSYDAFDMIGFNSFMNSTYRTITNEMYTRPSESYSSGGFSSGGFTGGGFSGGGSGGGGGGSW